MLTKSKLTIISLFAAILFASCEKVVEFDVGEMKPLIVINSLPNTDSMFFVNITYSRFFLDNRAFDSVTNATVTVDINGTPLSSYGHSGANYLFNYRATEGDSLTLHVSVPGHDEIIGGTRIISLPDMQPPLAEIDTLLPILQGNITFTISDPQDRENYYYIYIAEHDSGSRWNNWDNRWDTIDTVIHPYFFCLNADITDAEVNTTMGALNYFNELLFVDKRINGTNCEITLSVLMLKDTAENPIMRDYTLVVESLSREAYLYLKDVKANRDMQNYFAEPARLFSNLSSGLGIFASIGRQKYHLTFTYKAIPEEKSLIKRYKRLAPESIIRSSSAAPRSH